MARKVMRNPRGNHHVQATWGRLHTRHHTASQVEGMKPCLKTSLERPWWMVRTGYAQQLGTLPPRYMETRWWRPNLKTPKTPPKPHPHRPPCHHTDQHDQGQPPPNILQYVLLSAQSIGSGSYLWCTMRGSTGTEGCDRRQSATQVRQAWPARQSGHPLPHQGLPPTSSLHCTITHDHMQAQWPVAPGAHV